jgi:anti-sigma B factor antagonist
MALLIFTRQLGPAFVFELHGALDNQGAEKLEPRVAEALEAGHKLLLFDLTKLTSITSVGLSIFLGAYRRTQGDGAVRFAGMQDAVSQVFKVTGLAARFEIYNTVEDALVGPLPER